MQSIHSLSHLQLHHSGLTLCASIYRHSHNNTLTAVSAILQSQDASFAVLFQTLLRISGEVKVRQLGHARLDEPPQTPQQVRDLHPHTSSFRGPRCQRKAMQARTSHTASFIKPCVSCCQRMMQCAQ